MTRLTASSLALLLCVIVGACGDGDGANAAADGGAMPPPRTYSVAVVETKTLPGKKSANPNDGHSAAIDGIDEEDRIGDLGIASLWGGKSYYTNGKYNDNDWKVQRGLLKGAEQELPAYVIYPALHKATKFVASKHGLFYRFETAVDHFVYELKDGKFIVAAKIFANVITPGEYVRLGQLTGNGYVQPRTYVIAPATVTLNSYHKLGEGVRGATLATSGVGTHAQLVFTVDDAPYDTVGSYKAGPADHANQYGQNRRFFAVFEAGVAGVVWQAPKSRKVYVSWFAAAMDGIKTFELTGDDEAALASATSDANGTLYYVMVSEGNLTSAGTKDVRLHRAAADGTSHESKQLDASKKGLNVFAFGSAKGMSNDSSLRYSNGQLGMMLARKMHKSGDGLNHQGAISVVLDAATLTVVKNHGQSSGHSFESFLTVAQDGRFLAVDLGDNYPRGVHLHRFDGKERRSRVVHTFKTRHGTSAKNPAGKTFSPYKELTGAKSYFQWSNDNSTYTEIGGVVETSAGFAVVVSSENDKLDNAKAVGKHNAPRNIGLVLVRKDFEKASKGKGSAVVTDDLVLSKSDSVTGGYYSFGGKWMAQRVAGTRWLTSYGTKAENASRVKVAPRADGQFAVFWEQWTGKAYIETFGMVLDAQGTATVPPTSLGKALRLSRRDDPFVHEGKIVHVSGNASAKTLTLDVFSAL